MACQKHREYYKGYPEKYHPLTYFQEPEYKGQCPPEMSSVYLDYPLYHIKYKEPAILPHSVGRTSGFPPLPDRSLTACQRHRDYYKGYASSRHPLSYFDEPVYMWQCPPEMTPTYLGFPPSHVKYKQPIVLPHERGRTSVIPALPNRTLGGRFNKAACKAYVR